MSYPVGPVEFLCIPVRVYLAGASRRFWTIVMHAMRSSHRTITIGGLKDVQDGRDVLIALLPHSLEMIVEKGHWSYTRTACTDWSLGVGGLGSRLAHRSVPSYMSLVLFRVLK